MQTPEDVRAEIRKVRNELAEGPKAAYDAEVKAERAELAYDSTFDAALLSAEGTVDERKAQARLAAQAERETAFIARAEHNRIKLKIRQLESSLVALQATLKSIQLEGA